MTQSDSIAKVAPALVAAQGAIKPIPKDGKNPAFRSRYATLDAIMEAVRPALTANGLALVQGVKHPDTNEDGKLVGITVESRIVHTSGEWVASVVPVPVVKADAHGLGSALSYGRRYGISALLALTTDDDDDGNAAATPARAQERTQERAPARTPAPAPAPAREDTGASGRLYDKVPTTPVEAMPLAKAESLEIKGKRLGDMSDERLNALRQWAQEKGNTVYDKAAFTILAAREAALMADEAVADDDDSLGLNVPQQPARTRDDLPF